MITRFHVLKALQTAADRGFDSRPDMSRWADVYLDNALDLIRQQDPGYQKRSFSGHLSALTKEKLYEPQSDPDFKRYWGRVRVDILGAKR